MLKSYWNQFLCCNFYLSIYDKKGAAIHFTFRCTSILELCAHLNHKSPFILFTFTDKCCAIVKEYYKGMKVNLILHVRIEYHCVHMFEEKLSMCGYIKYLLLNWILGEKKSSGLRWYNNLHNRIWSLALLR